MVQVRNVHRCRGKAMRKMIKGLIIIVLFLALPTWVAFWLPHWLALDLKDGWYGFPYFLTAVSICLFLIIFGIVRLDEEIR